MAAWAWWAGAALALLLVVTLFQFNRMVVLRNRCRESWSNVDTELQRRHDLVPNLVRAVQGIMAHERATLAAVVEARGLALAAHGQTERAARENALSQGLTRLFALAEAYPALRSSANFLRLQEELAVTEDRIQAARRFYNANVRDYRDATRQFPGLLFAGLFGFRAIGFFEVESPQVRQAPGVRLHGTGAA